MSHRGNYYYLGDVKNKVEFLKTIINKIKNILILLAIALNFKI